MKRFIKITLVCLLSFLVVSCATLKGKNEGVSGKSVKSVEKAKDKVDAVNGKIVDNDKQRLQNIGIFASGTEYALSKIEDSTKEIDTARELNARVLTLSETPSLEELKQVHKMVDDLISNLIEQRKKGLKELAEKDEIINDMQLEKKYLEEIKDKEIKKYMNVAETAASKADQYATTLNQMDSWWGLKAIFYGLKKFVTSASLFIGIFAFIYLLLRVLSTMSPIAAAAFQIFDVIASVFINIIKGLAPGAAKIAKLVPEATSTLYKETLGHIVDTIELMKAEDKKAIIAGQPPKKYTLEEILKEFKVAMDQSHKNVVDEVKVETNWK